MAGHVNLDDNSMGEDDCRLSESCLNNKDSLDVNHNVASQSSLSIASTSIFSTATSPRNALITESPGVLELRQNNAQDCQNLIIASVDRATVEISRTIIALNATFSQQLQQASISASNGIKSAQGSASTTISIVVQSASIATSSAFSRLNIANLAVTSFSSASISDIARVSSSSSSEVSTLSATVNLLQSSISSLQASAADALAAAQSNAQSSAAAASAALASAQSALSAASAASNAAAGIAATPAAAVPLAAATGSTVTTVTPVQVCATGTLPLPQVLAIGIGAIIVVTLLSFAIYFVIIMMKNRKQARDSYLDEKSGATSPKNLPSRYSSSARTGNAITLKFNPTKSSEAPVPSKPAMQHTESPRTSSSFSSQRNSIDTLVAGRSLDFPSSALSTWPLTLSFMDKVDLALKSPAVADYESRPRQNDIPAIVPVPPPASSSQLKSRDISSPRYVQPTIPPVPVISQTTKASKSSRSPRDSSTLKGTTAPRRLIVASPPPPPPLPLPTPPPVLEVESPATPPHDDPFDDPIEGIALDKLATAPHESMLVDSHSTYPTRDQPRHSTSLETGILEASIADNKEHTRNRLSSYVDIETPRPKVERAPEPEIKVAPEPEIEIAPEPEVEVVPEPEAEVAPEPEMVIAPEPEIEVAPEPEIEIAPEPEVEVAPEPEAEVAPEPEMVIAPEPEIEVAPEPETETIPERTIEQAPLSPLLIAQVYADEPLVEEEQQAYEAAATVERPSTPVKPTPTVEVDIIDAKLPSPEVTKSTPPESSQLLAPANMMNFDRDVSPLRRNPLIPDMTPSLAEPEEPLPVVPADEHEDDDEDGDEDEDEDEDATDMREERGRSMIRTSDIIESRLSGIQAGIEEPKPADTAQSYPELDRTFSPLRLNPVDRSMISVPTEQRSVAKSPLADNPKRRSKSFSPPPRSNSLRRVITNNSLSRDNSPLRQNPVRAPYVGASTKLSASAIAAKPQTKDKFAQILSQFKFMADQNPIDSAKASQEVTQRAIAGIAIPISMREQAVRSSGKSRDRGKSHGR